MRANTLRRLMAPPTASPKRIARSTAPLFNTGKTPGSAMSTAEAWLLGTAPKAVDAPEKILDTVESWVWVSSPMTTSQPPFEFTPRIPSGRAGASR